MSTSGPSSGPPSGLPSGSPAGRSGGGGPGAGKVLAGRGPRACEAWLLAEVGRALDRAREDPSLLARPVRIVVPSRSLRLHLGERLLSARGGSAVGVRIQTLRGLAEELAREGGAAPEGDALARVLIRREAQREPALAAGLDALHDGYGAVAAGVDDLLDAGLEPVHAEALIERLAAGDVPREVAERAGALVRVAARVAAAVEVGAVGHGARVFALARERLARAPDRPPARALLLHGFADATGVQADCIEALLRREDARIVLDAPQAGASFGAAFRDRLLGAGQPEAIPEPKAIPEPEAIPGPEGAGSATLLRAASRTAEVRAVAAELRARLDAGAAPERLAVVARDLAPYRLTLRRELRRLAVPFSGVGEPGAATAARRRLEALHALLEEGEGTRMEAWLDALVRVATSGGRRAPLAPAHAADLRQALHRLGALRLGEVARLAGAAAPPVALDARRGLSAAPEGGEGGVLPRRRLSAEALAAAGRTAEAVARRLGRRPSSAPLAVHAAWLSRLVRELGWRRDTPGGAELGEALASLPASELAVTPDEFARVLRRATDEAGLAPLGGAGGGVQVLGVMEARARTFDAVFVLGLSRGVFPRPVREDPLLPDAVRRRLREVLPDLPVKQDGFDEERFLFSRLLASSGAVWLCHAERDDEGRPLSRSPLLEPVARAGAAERVAPLPHAPEAGVADAAERALRAGLRRDRSAFDRALAAALAERAAEGTALARVRAAVLDELESRAPRPGPYFGFVGAAVRERDPRRAAPFVTALEQVARCPWEAFLTRVLRLAPVPDAAAALPSALDARRVGVVVHRALERIAGLAPGGDPALWRSRDPHRPPWPDDAALDALLEEAAADVLRDEPVGLPGFARVLARRARPLVLRARDADWADGPPPVVAVEALVAATLRVAGEPRSVRARVDRVDRVGERLRFTDYKTGRPIADQRTARGRSDRLRQAVASGRSLQAAAYARAGGPGSEGRYLELSERAPEAALVLPDDPSFDAAFEGAVATLFGGWDRGSFPPRLREADRDEEPGACRGCDVKDACLRGDSGARGRLARFAERDAPHRSPAEAAAAALYALGRDAS